VQGESNAKFICALPGRSLSKARLKIVQVKDKSKFIRIRRGTPYFRKEEQISATVMDFHIKSLNLPDYKPD
jgi:hypothetical protein